MAALKTSSLTLPANFAEGIVKKMESGSAVAQLSQAKPMLFGDTNIVTFNTTPRAEFVEEGGKKSSMDAAFGLVKATPRKAQVFSFTQVTSLNKITPVLALLGRGLFASQSP